MASDGTRMAARHACRRGAVVVGGRSRGVAYAMLDSLTDSLVGVMRTLQGKKTISEDNIEASLK